MDSINKNQPEDNRKDLQGREATEKIKELVKAASNMCFFCTDQQVGHEFATRPMAVQQVDDNGTFWFLSPSDSDKNEELEANPKVQLLFQGSTYSEFLNVYGHATISKNKAKIKELWQPRLKTWFTEGEDDPRITVIEVRPTNGYYWDTKNGEMVSFAKQLIGAAIGKTLDDSVEGSLKV